MAVAVTWAVRRIGPPGHRDRPVGSSALFWLFGSQFTAVTVPSTQNRVKISESTAGPTPSGPGQPPADAAGRPALRDDTESAGQARDRLSSSRRARPGGTGGGTSPQDGVKEAAAAAFPSLPGLVVGRQTVGDSE